MSDQRPHVVQYVTEGRDNFAALRPQQEGRSGLPNKMHTIMHIAALLTTCTAAATYTSAFSTIESVESAVAIASGILLELSPQQLIDCMPNPKHCGGRGGCEGATQSLGFEYVRQQGLADLNQYPYCMSDGKCKYYNSSMHAAGIKGWVQLPTNNYTALMHAVATVGPISISVDASGWQHYSGGVYNHPGSDIVHAVLLVGYGIDDELGDYWLVRNSWGSDWGEDGYIRLKRNGEGKEPCNQDTHPGDGYACKPLPKSVTVCGMDGILSDSSCPTGAYIGGGPGL
jgi:cathepsin L